MFLEFLFSLRSLGLLKLLSLRDLNLEQKILDLLNLLDPLGCPM